MTMKRGGSAVRERRSLRRVAASLEFLCPDCGSTDFRVEWNSSHRRYRLAILHDVTCPVLLSSRLKRSVDDYLRDALIAGGHHLACYGDRDVTGLHRAVPR